MKMQRNELKNNEDSTISNKPMKCKLDMLEPAGKICPLIVISGFLAVIFYMLKLTILMMFFAFLAGLFVLIILIGVAIELKQDEILFQRHEKQKDKARELKGSYECEYCGARFQVKQGFCPSCGKSLKE